MAEMACYGIRERGRHGCELRPADDMGSGTLWETCVRLGRGDCRTVTARLAWVALLCSGLAGCSAPFRTVPPTVIDAETGEPMGGLMSFCYGTEMNNPEEIKTLAEEQCEGRLVFVEQNMFLNDCPLLQIARVTYQCQPLAAEEAGGQTGVSGDVPGGVPSGVPRP